MVNSFKTMAVAEHFFPQDVDTVVIANGNNFPDGLSGGPVANASGAPLILVIDSVHNHAKEYLADNEAFRLIVMGGKGVISDDTVDVITDDGYLQKNDLVVVTQTTN